MSDGKPARAWLHGKTAADLDIVEHGGRLYFPDAIQRLKPGGKFEEVTVAVCVPRAPEKALARRDAIALFTKWKLDRDKDADYFDTLDKFAVLAHAIRDPATHGQFQPLEWLVSGKENEGFEERSLWAVWERLKIYQEFTDPTITEPDEEEVLAAAAGIDRVRNLSPLVAIAGPALDSCVISMASLLCRYRTLVLSRQSTENFTPGH